MRELRVNFHLAQRFFRPPTVIAWVGLIVFLLSTDLAIAKFIQLDGVTDVKTRFSRGCSTLQDIAELARSRNIDAVIFGDHARDALEYGLFPFERVINKRYENSSILTIGASAYIAEINDNDKQYEELLLIPGGEVAPFYYWTEKNSLFVNNSDKHLFVVGLPDAESYEQLPILDSNFSKRYLAQYQYFFSGFTALFFLCLVLIIKGYRRKTTSIVSGIIFLLAINNQPFKSSSFNQYSGDHGIKPYQELINYVNSSGGLIFWNDMEAADGVRQEGKINYQTEPYPKDLILASGYTGFQSVGNSPINQIAPGNEWDHVLSEYLSGQRAKPIWGYGASNYLCEEKKIQLGDIRTIFLVRQKSRYDLMDAMAKGRMYAVRQTGDERLSLDDFTIRDIKSGREATMGEELQSIDFPELTIKVRSSKGTEKTVRLSVIRNGLEVKTETVTLPYEMEWRDVDVKVEEGPVFYRIKVEEDLVNYLVSNPIFVRFSEEVPEQVAVVSRKTADKLSIVKPKEPRVATTQNPTSPSIAIPNQPVQKEVAHLNNLLETKNVIKTPNIDTPIVKQPKAPQVKNPPAASVAPISNIQKSVVAKINGVSLKNGPGPKFPEVGRLNKGDRLTLIRVTAVKFKEEPWLMVDADGRKAYVWSKLVVTE